MQVNFFVILLKVGARARILLSNEAKKLAKILLNIHLRMTINQWTSIQQSTTDAALNEELSAACDSSINIEQDVIEVSETVSAQSAQSEFKAYLNSLDENHAFSDADSAYSKLIASKFNDALSTAEKLRAIKFSSV